MLEPEYDSEIRYRRPLPKDGSEIWTLVRNTGVLDLNSPYAYLLVGEHFAPTSIVAELNETIVGFVFAYVKPDTPDVLFVWQVGVSESSRGQGAGLKMLKNILSGDACHGIRTLETTITPSNKASRSLFTALARDLNSELTEQENHFPASWFPVQGHEAESLFIISQIDTRTISA